MVHIRVDEKIKAKAAKTLASMGLTVSDAVRLLLTRIASEKALPFEVRVPNRETIAAMRAGDRGKVTTANSVAELMTGLNANGWSTPSGVPKKSPRQKSALAAEVKLRTKTAAARAGPIESSMHA
jgi:DNA-damage-inducible protein J